jgi:hypothetical protein
MAVEKTTSKINDATPATVPTKSKPPKLTANPYEVGGMLGKSHNFVRRLVRDGVLPSLPGHNIRIPLIAVQRYLESLSGGAK